MTTELTSTSTVSTQSSLSRRLPTVSNSNESVSQENPDNVIRIDFEKRQQIAKPDQITKVQPDELRQEDDSKTELNKSIYELNNATQMVSRNLQFHIDKASGRTVITVKDTQTNEIIRQIPSDQFLAISGRLKELQDSKQQADDSTAGILFTSQT